MGKITQLTARNVAIAMPGAYRFAGVLEKFS
jgi:hypothetical protein